MHERLTERNIARIATNFLFLHLKEEGGGSAAEFCVGALPALVVLFLCAKAACCMITNADCNRLKARVLFLLEFLVYLVT
jgi:sorbitol-specific phosphotransferase system component IIC